MNPRNEDLERYEGAARELREWVYGGSDELSMESVQTTINALEWVTRKMVAYVSGEPEMLSSVAVAAASAAMDAISANRGDE